MENEKMGPTQMIVRLFGELVFLQAQLDATHAIYSQVLGSLIQDGDRQKLNEEYNKSYRQIFEEAVVSHPVFDDMWKDTLLRELGGIDGLKLF